MLHTHIPAKDNYMTSGPQVTTDAAWELRALALLVRTTPKTGPSASFVLIAENQVAARHRLRRRSNFARLYIWRFSNFHRLS
jgi:hypothetical protein